MKFLFYRLFLFSTFLIFGVSYSSAQVIDSFRIHGGIKITIDKPENFSSKKKTIVTFFALPNGSTTEQTMGKRIKEGDDWHYDIQHIKAQTAFIRKQLRKKNFVVIYLENYFRSWPLWKQNHPEFPTLIPHLVDSLTALVSTKNTSIYLNGHSGGGSFIFGYLKGVKEIPGIVKRISFLDSDYGYDNTYYFKFKDWLQRVKGSALNVFAYNDSVALYNGKRFVSDTGGTWYRSHLFLNDLQKDFSFSKKADDSMIVFKSIGRHIQFYFKTNPDRKIFHTQQVEYNGFIHSVLSGTRYDSKKYRYYSSRAYDDLIE
ncbi:MAG: hypothetical protein LC128_09220 [Chitinophagales bacterium]|nr:hypothetical protein [Chitinophagales bacterium]